jgi:hypothetical protein
MDKNSQRQNEQGSSQQQDVDARFNEEPHVIFDRLRPLTAGQGGDFTVIGQKPDGSPFMWSTTDKDSQRELAKSAAPVLAGLSE